MPDRCSRLNLFATNFFTATSLRLTTLLLSLIITVALNSPAVAAGPALVRISRHRW